MTPTDSKTTYYPDESNRVLVRCPGCGFTRTLDASGITRKEMISTCRCGRKFSFILEFRRHFRKSVRLAGKYSNPTRGAAGPIIVENLSMTGMGFTTLDAHQIGNSDVLQIDFILDNTNRSHIHKTARAISVRGRFVGVEFLDRGYDNEFGYYMMP